MLDRENKYLEYDDDMKFSVWTKLGFLAEVICVVIIIASFFAVADMVHNETSVEYAERLNKYRIVSQQENVYYTNHYNEKYSTITFKGFSPQSKLPFIPNKMNFHGIVTLVGKYRVFIINKN